MTILRSHGESLSVINAPVPGVLCVHSVMYSRKAGLLRVTVKLSQFDSGMRVQKLVGFPKVGFSLEMRFQSCQAPSLQSGVSPGSDLGRGAGGVVFVPMRESVVMEPRVVITMSVCGCTWTTPVMPFSMM